MKETLEKHGTRFKISETSRRFEARVRLLEGSGLLLDMRNCFVSYVKRDNPNIFSSSRYNITHNDIETITVPSVKVRTRFRE